MTQKELHEIIYVCWEEVERGWGERPDGCSLHLNVADSAVFEKNFYESLPEKYKYFGHKLGPLPEEYDRPAGKSVTAYVTNELYEKIKTSENGIRLWKEQERTAFKSEELVYGTERSGWVVNENKDISK